MILICGELAIHQIERLLRLGEANMDVMGYFFDATMRAEFVGA